MIKILYFHTMRDATSANEIKICNFIRCQQYNRTCIKAGQTVTKRQIRSQKFQKFIKSYTQYNSSKDNRGIILATTHSKIIGLASFVLLERLNQPFREFWIPELVVSEKNGRLGIGILLIQKCESIAKRRKCYRIRLESRNDRIDSHDFYKKIGFQQIALAFEKRM